MDEKPSFGLTSLPSTTTNIEEEDGKSLQKLPSVLSMRLYEWIGLLTNPQTGAFPNGVSPKQLDRLARNQIAAASEEAGSELKPLWKSSNHLGVMLWNEVKAGRVIRSHKACYVGANFHPKVATPPQPRPTVVKSIFNAETPDQFSVAPKSDDRTTECSKSSEQPKASATEGSTRHLEFQCFVCKQGRDQTGNNGVLKCVECVYQTHVQCAYPNDTVPVNLLKRLPTAISNWRCYDCKRCHLCGGKDDSNDGLLLCDGCDAGEHMGCQRPVLVEVPPAPWFCSFCRVESGDRSTIISSTVEHNRVVESPVLIIDESRDKKPPSVAVIDGSPSPDCPSNQSEEADCNGKRPPPTPQPRVVKTSSPSLSDETPEVGRQRRGSNASGVSTIPEEKPVRTRLGKRPADGQWIVDGHPELSAPPRHRRRRSYKKLVANSQTAIADSAPDQKISRSGSSSSRDNDEAKFDLGSRRRRTDKDESDLLPFMSEDLPSLNEDDAKSVKEAKFWSVDDTVSFLERMGYAESAKAFKREEIDGAALLLLRRQDVLLNLSLKLGPALKTYKFVRYIQSTVRSS